MITVRRKLLEEKRDVLKEIKDSMERQSAMLKEIKGNMLVMQTGMRFIRQHLEAARERAS